MRNISGVDRNSLTRQIIPDRLLGRNFVGFESFVRHKPHECNEKVQAKRDKGLYKRKPNANTVYDHRKLAFSVTAKCFCELRISTVKVSEAMREEVVSDACHE